MKIKLLFSVLLIFLLTDSICREKTKNESVYAEVTAINDLEKEAFKSIYEVYKKLPVFHNEIYDLDFDYEYVLKIFPKIDSVERYYTTGKDKGKTVLFNKVIFTPEKKDLIWKAEITFSPILSSDKGFINIELGYIAAANTEVSVSFILKNNIYESYHFYTSSGNGRTVDVYRVNGIEKFSSEHDLYPEKY